MDCIFCQIVNQSIPTPLIYEDDEIVAFNDIRPQAPIHQLIIPKKHIPSVNFLTPENSLLLGQMILVAKDLAASVQVAEEGYRLVMNCNAHGGQEVYHLHLHLLAGRPMHWPPG